MNVDQAIQKATLLLDLKNDAAEAERALSEALFGVAPSTSVFRARVLLASILSDSRPSEARQHLTDALSSYNPEWDDLVAAELAEARALLERIA